jgi:hypothetical protein
VSRYHRWRGTLHRHRPGAGYAQLLISLRTTEDRAERFGVVRDSVAWAIYDLFKFMDATKLSRKPRALWAFVDARGIVDHRTLTPDIGALQHLQATGAAGAGCTIEKIELHRLTPGRTTE